MGSTRIPATEGVSIRIDDNGDDRRYYLCVPDYDSPEFDLTPLLVPRQPAEEDNDE